MIIDWQRHLFSLRVHHIVSYCCYEPCDSHFSVKERNPVRLPSESLYKISEIVQTVRNCTNYPKLRIPVSMIFPALFW